MQESGVVSSHYPSEHVFYAGSGLYVRIARVDRNFACLQFARYEQLLDGVSRLVTVDIPAKYRLFDLYENEACVVAPVGNQWVVAFSAKYVLKNGDIELLTLHPRRQHVIQTVCPLVIGDDE